MILSFSNHIQGRPTYFVEKIWEGLKEIPPFKGNESEWINDSANALMNADSVSKYPNGSPNVFDEVKPKIHTIREDSKDRWKVGNKIHFVINNRTKNRFQFAPVLEVKSIDYFRVFWEDGNPAVMTCSYEKGLHMLMPFYIGDRKGIEWTYGLEQMNNLALNDGFESIEDFFNWFNDDFTGKIIHWTDNKY